MIAAARGLAVAGLLCALWPAAKASAAGAEEAVAVLSAAPGPYQAAYAGFLKEFGQPVAAFQLPGEKPALGPRARVVVAFGGEAVLQAYPSRATVIACLAPGVSTPAARRGAFSSVAMKPSPQALLTRLRKLQPGLKSLAALWSSEGTAIYLKDLKRAASALGIEILAVRVAGPAGVPDALRAQAGRADSIWLAPDPGLVTPEAFQTIKQFSWDNAMPFYAPTMGLAAAGAAAAVSVSPAETGRQAAALARQALAGEAMPESVYPDKTELTINLDSAARAGLRIAPEALAGADKVIR